MQHLPVMADEVIAGLGVRPGETLLDATLGFGGHSLRLLEELQGSGRLVGVDRDLAALKLAEERLTTAIESRGGRKPDLLLLHGSFGEIGSLLDKAGIEAVDRVLFDLGVSSMQLDETERGFSFQRDGPLDMRMDPTQELTAADLLNSRSQATIESILREWGEERFARRIARELVIQRERKPLETTGELSDLVRRCYPPELRRGRIHPATRSFQAIRIAVNRELEQIAPALRVVVDRLKPGGRVAVLAYHSLEDRIVKQEFARLAGRCECDARLPICVCGAEPLVRVVTRRPLTPGEEEIRANPRSRSARLRIAERLGAEEGADGEDS